MPTSPIIHSEYGEIRELILYADAVEIVEIRSVILPFGTVEVRIPYATPTLDILSLQCLSVNAHIQTMSCEQLGKDHHPPEDASSSKERIRELRSRALGTQALLDFLESLEPDDDPPTLQTEAMWQSFTHIVHARADAQSRLSAYQAELDQLTARASPHPPPLNASTLVVTLTSVQSGPTQLAIRARHGWGTWRPRFHIYMTKDEPKVVMEADIWLELPVPLKADELHLVHHPAPPTHRPFVPAPWTIGSNPVFDERSVELYAQGTKERKRPRPSAQKAPAPLSTRGPKTPFPRDIYPTRYLRSVALDSSQPRVVLEPEPSLVEKRYICRPAINPYAHIQLAIEPHEDAIWPGGWVDFSFDGQRHPPTRMDSAKKGRPWTWHLGPELRVHTQRSVTIERVIKGGLHRDEVHQVNIQTVVRNQLNHPIHTIIEDQIPSSTDPRLSVQLVDTNPQASLTDSKGVLRFILELAAQEKQTVSFTYTISSPHNYRIIQTLGRSSP
ncbi:MAG: DUF4139 domain-containing protein [Myxococcales bacterium]|nr:DUF4139 domain-containing protein [Myxococcales bacterium]